ncbi:hypothetical protein FRX31_010350 [Thalictrum thalictroides]|uniref:Uncharacterized protein n=1 Tax=Thalictrum thalictroides TaxID=46969 RepID=A0A7J6WU98_THATH|nr:hypothetical protein FRX31_010350 [Thalictrum thalictroides]
MVVGCEVDISVISLCCEDLQSSSPILFFAFFPLPGGIPTHVLSQDVHHSMLSRVVVPGNINGWSGCRFLDLFDRGSMLGGCPFLVFSGIISVLLEVAHFSKIAAILVLVLFYEHKRIVGYSDGKESK